MDKKYYKKVMLPISVSANDYCWGDGCCCTYFNNEYGHPSCDLNASAQALDIDWNELKYDKQGRVPKPKACLALKEV